MDIFVLILSIVLLLAGAAGCIIPAIPGPPLAYAGILLAHLSGYAVFSAAQLIVWLLLTVIVQVFDYLAPAWGTRLGGGSKWGKWGCIAGTVIGLFFFSPIGIILGPFFGAVAGELINGKDFAAALKSGLGSFLGFAVSTVVKLFLCIYLIIEFIRNFATAV